MERSIYQKDTGKDVDAFDIPRSIELFTSPIRNLHATLSSPSVTDLPWLDDIISPTSPTTIPPLRVAPPPPPQKSPSKSLYVGHRQIRSPLDHVSRRKRAVGGGGGILFCRSCQNWSRKRGVPGGGTGEWLRGCDVGEQAWGLLRKPIR